MGGGGGGSAGKLPMETHSPSVNWNCFQLPKWCAPFVQPELNAALLPLPREWRLCVRPVSIVCWFVVVEGPNLWTKRVRWSADVSAGGKSSRDVWRPNGFDLAHPRAEIWPKMYFLLLGLPRPESWGLQCWNLDQYWRKTLSTRSNNLKSITFKLWELLAI